MTELTPEQAKELGAELRALRAKYQAQNPKLTLAGWIEQLGSCGYRYLQAEKGELNVPKEGDWPEQHWKAEYDALFERGQIREPATLRGKIIQCLYIGGIAGSFGLACIAADTILKHVSESINRIVDAAA